MSLLRIANRCPAALYLCMTKTTLGLAALMLCSAVAAAPARQPHLADVALSATPDDASLARQWRVDFVPQRGNQRPPFMGRLLVYRAGQQLPVDIIAVRVQVALEDVQLSMPDVDGDGHPDLVFSGVRDRVYQRQADAVYLWSAPGGRFVLTPDLSRLGSVFPSDVTPGCVSAEFWCADTGIDVLELCRKPGTERWVKTPNPHPDCEDRD
jgi:hypothetical protein